MEVLKKLLITSFLPAALIGCGSDSSSSDEDLERDLRQAFIGNWVSECVSSGTKGFIHIENLVVGNAADYKIERVSITGSEFEKRTDYYEDSDCTSFVDRQESQGTYTSVELAKSFSIDDANVLIGNEIEVKLECAMLCDATLTEVYWPGSYAVETEVYHRILQAYHFDNAEKSSVSAGVNYVDEDLYQQYQGQLPR